MRIAVGAVVLWSAFFGVAVGQAAEPASGQQGRIFQDYGTFTGAKRDDQGIVWLTLWEPYVRYRVSPGSDAKMDELVLLLRRAGDGGRGVQLRYDAGQGRINRATGTLDYPLCSLVLDDLRFEPAQRCTDGPPAQPTNFEAALALARAQISVGDLQAAQDLLTRFGTPREVTAKKLLLRIRAQDESELAAAAPRASPEADRATSASLADDRALAALEPDDVEHQFEIAGALLDLGGYAEARAVYDAILKRWPAEDYRVAVRIGALYRVQGDYEKALQALNDLVARSGPQPGMKFHYHRGWTLSLLGRYDEAIKELTEGLESQPDYTSAYMRRACAYASVGQLKNAVADADQAARLLDLLPGAATSKVLRDDKEAAVAVQAKLRAAIANGDRKALTGTCSGPTWDLYEHPRSRSPVMPAA